MHRRLGTAVSARDNGGLPIYTTPVPSLGPVVLQRTAETPRSRQRLYQASPTSHLIGGQVVSIVRVGLGETKHFAEGYEAIFGKKKRAGAAKKKGKTRTAAPRKKKPKKK